MTRGTNRPPTTSRRRVSRGLLACASLLLGTLTLHVISSSQGDTAVAASSDSQTAFRVRPLSLVIDEPCSSEVSPGASSAGLTAAAAGGAGHYAASSPLQLESALPSGDGAYLTIDASALSALPRQGRITLHDFILEADRRVILDLEPYEVFGPNSEFVAATDAGDVPLPAPETRLYRGTVKGKPNSRVFLGLSPGIVNGYVAIEQETYSLSTGPGGSLAASGRRCAIGKLGSLPGSNPIEDACEVVASDASFPVRRPEQAGGASLTPGLRMCLLAVECDFAYFEQMGSDKEAALAYVAQLVAAVSDIYERDLGTIIWLNFVRIWTTSKQPFDPSECGLRGLNGWGLNGFRLYGNVHLVDKEWNLAYKFSGCGGGGAGYQAALCTDSDRGRYPYATSRVQGFFPFPIEANDDNYDVRVVAHELGHNFGSSHTHCYEPPIDFCDSTESSCYVGPEICSRGTLMSYCNRCGGIENIDMHFHPRVIEYIEPFIANSCLPIVSSGFYVCNDSPDVLIVDSIRSTAHWLSASRQSFRIAPHDSTVVAVRADWRVLKETGVQGELHVYAGDVSPIIVPVTANRGRPFTDFSVSQSTGCWPLLVDFADETSNGATEWYWDFGDGDTSRERSPSHAYDRAGEFNVTLTTTNDCGGHTATAATPIVVTESKVCCPYQIYVVSRDQDSLHVKDLWSCAPSALADPSTFRYEIIGNTEPDCGARVDANRYLSILPTDGWYGQSDLSMQATGLDGCKCRSTFRIIINDPPRISLLAPEPGVHIANERYTIRWSDSDADNNARVYFFRSNRDNCQVLDTINPSGVFEDEDGEADTFEWRLNGVPDGYYRVSAVIYDLYASARDCSEGIVLVDRTPPTTVSSYTCTSIEQGGWCNGSVIVQLAAEDTLTGVQETFYRINGAPWQRYTEPVRVSLAGINAFEYYSTDVAGNEEPIRSTNEPLRIDKLPPNVSGFSSNNIRFHHGDFTSPTPRFGIQFTDDGIGVDPATIIARISPGVAEGELEFTLDSPGFVYNEAIRFAELTVSTPLQPGDHTLSVEMADGLGNEASASTEFVVGTNLDVLDIVNYPNPFPQNQIIGTSFTFVLTQPAIVSVRIFDLSGDLMKALNERQLDAGYNAIEWDGIAQDGLTLANGTYIYEIVAKNASGSVRYLEKLAVLR